MEARPDGIDLPAITHHMLCVQLETRAEMNLAWAGQRYAGVGRTGDVSFIPAYTPTRWRWQAGVRECVHVFLDPAILARVVEAEFDRDPARVELVADLCFSENVLFRLSSLLRDELLDGGPGERVLVDGLGAALTVHLLRRHSTLSLPSPRLRGGLPPGRLRRVQEHMETHLGEEIRLADLARLAGLSENQFRRVFRSATGRGPHRWLTERRVERAQMLLRERRMSIAEVALAVGYAGQSHFTAQFRAITGTTPDRYRRDL